MTGRERILAAMAGRATDVTPVAIDYMGLYLEERTERAYVDAYRERLARQGCVQVDPDEDVQIRARAITQAYDVFDERHDWLNVFGGPSPETLSRRALIQEGDKIFELDQATGERRQMLLAGQVSKTEEMRDRFARLTWAHHGRHEVDAMLKAHRERVQATRGDMRLVEILAREHGRQYFVYTGAGAPFVSLNDLISFEEMMTALHDAPDVVHYMLEYILETRLQLLQRFKDAGGLGVRIEECLASADIISPAMYETFALPYEEKMCAALRRMGLKTILYFCGDVMPRLPALRQLPTDALMVEESKKDFDIDIGEVRSAVGPHMCLFGNIDVYDVVLKATERELEAEVARQVRVAGQAGRFVVGVGSPLTLDTPPERADLLIRYARQQRPA